MSRLLAIRTVLGGAVWGMVLLAVLSFSAPAWSQHGGGGGHGGFGGHGGGGHSYGGHGGFGGHRGGGHSYGGHGYGSHYGGSHGSGVHGGLHGYSHYGYGHSGYGHGSGGHGYGGHGYGLHGYGHGGYLHGYGFHDYYPHSFYSHYPSYYDAYPYYYWYPTYGASFYPWYGFFGDDYDDELLVSRRPVVVDEHADDALLSATDDDRTDASRSTVTAQGLEYQRRAESAFRGGRYDEALRLANHALVEMPRNGKLLLFVSQALFATGDYRGAAAAIHQAATMLDKGDWGYVVKNWRTHYRGTAYHTALDKLTKYVKENPDAAYARFLRAYHFGFLGEEEFARKEMTKAIELESRDRLAIELLTMFGGEPPAKASNPAGSNRASGANPSGDEHEGEAEHNHDAHEHDTDADRSNE